MLRAKFIDQCAQVFPIDVVEAIEVRARESKKIDGVHDPCKFIRQGYCKVIARLLQGYYSAISVHFNYV